MKERTLSILLAIIGILGIVGCDEGVPNVDDILKDGGADVKNIIEAHKPKDGGLIVKEIHFDPDYKTFHVITGVSRDLTTLPFTDSTQVRFNVTESAAVGILQRRSQPRLVHVENIEGEKVAQMGVKILVLVDLTMAQEKLDEVAKYLKLMRTVFDHDNLFVSFVYGDQISEVIKASDYVLDNYFVKQPVSYKFLFRSIYAKVQEMAAHTGLWNTKNGQKNALIVFSDGITYEDELPMDPEHFEWKEKLLGSIEEWKPFLNISYFEQPDGDMSNQDDVAEFMASLCKGYGGISGTAFAWTEFLEKAVGIKHDGEANRFDFVNPDHKIYNGIPVTLKLECVDVKTDSVFGYGSITFVRGNMYNPIIVNGYSIGYLLVLDLFLGFMVYSLAYLILQILVPFVRYKLFARKYFMRYTNSNMSVGDKMIPQTCYFCKAPFEIGDEIVVRCQHVMHKSCWVENDYHCPEYGRHCKSGSHYYNTKNIFDPHNALYFTKWVLMGIIAAVLAWAAFTALVGRLSAIFITKFLQNFVSQIPDNAEHSQIIEEWGKYMTVLPSFGLVLAFFLTFCMSLLTIRGIPMGRRLLSACIRGIIAGVGSYIFFFIENVVSGLLKMEHYPYLTDWAPWVLSTFLIAYTSTESTRVRLKGALLALSVVVALLSMFLFTYVLSTFNVDYRTLMLFSYMIYAVGVSLCIAYIAPRSERYFLNVKGPVKEMDVALYKWLRQSPKAFVTIGKSVDATLQMGWDVNSNIGPIVADIRFVRRRLRLKALDNGVYVDGKPLAPDDSITIYHGTSFDIGQTTFTYIEKDS